LQNMLLNILSAFAKLWKATTSFVMSVCLSVWLTAWNNLVPSGRIFLSFGIWECFKNLSRKLTFR
jgi:hypothetical protein